MDLSRRQLLVGGASIAFLSACGSSDSGASSTTTAAGKRSIYNAFDPNQPVGKALRLPIGVTEADGSFASDIPAALRVQLRKPDGTKLAPQELRRRQEGIPRGFYPLETTLDAPGRWTIEAELDGKAVTTTIEARAASDVPAVVGAGDRLPKVPTTDDCTRDPVCPFHAAPLDQLIGGSKPIVLLVSTPAFCKVAICGPVLDLLVDRRSELERFAVLHTEVYTDKTATTTLPIIGALGMTYEPALFLARADGTVVERLDYIYDADELDAALGKL
jgi:hypothetical protein